MSFHSVFPKSPAYVLSHFHNLKSKNERKRKTSHLGTGRQKFKTHISPGLMHDAGCSSKGFLPAVVDIMVIWDKFRRRQWHPSPVLLLGKSHGWRSLEGCSPWGRWGSDTTEWLHFHFSLFTFMHWRRKWQPTPVFLPGESQGQGSLVGCHLWGRTELDTTELT